MTKNKFDEDFNSLISSFENDIILEGTIQDIVDDNIGKIKNKYLKDIVVGFVNTLAKGRDAIKNITLLFTKHGMEVLKKVIDGAVGNNTPTNDDLWKAHIEKLRKENEPLINKWRAEMDAKYSGMWNEHIMIQNANGWINGNY